MPATAAGKSGTSANEAAAKGRNCAPPPPLVLGKGPVAWRDCADTPEMIRLQGGSFLMGEQGRTGTLYELPVHERRVREFSISK